MSFEHWNKFVSDTKKALEKDKGMEKDKTKNQRGSRRTGKKGTEFLYPIKDI